MPSVSIPSFKYEIDKISKILKAFGLFIYFSFFMQMIKLEEQQFLGEATCALSEVCDPNIIQNRLYYSAKHSIIKYLPRREKQRKEYASSLNRTLS